MPAASANRKLAQTVLEQALAWGAREFVVCAGSRNSPLVLPLLEARGKGILRVWHHYDERAAAFFALGLAKRDGRPVAVVTTSGTAAAELLPATIEAHYSGIPLVLLTADRPKRFRATGAPQAIEQAGLFGPYVEACLDAEEAVDFPVGFPWNRRGPIHLNPGFEEPEPDFGPFDLTIPPGPNRVGSGTQQGWVGDPTLLSRFVADFTGGTVLLGALEARDRDEVKKFVKILNCPVWAEATSGLRESKILQNCLIRDSEAFFGRKRPHKILRIGGVPSLRFWRDLETRFDIEVLSISRQSFTGLGRVSERIDWLDFSEVFVKNSENHLLSELSEIARIDSLLQSFPESEAAWYRRLSEAIPSEAPLFLGNSLAIRQWNLAASFKNSHPNCHASRGANGIDGQISTFLGVAAGAGESWGIFGDLTALHDLGAPWVLDQLGRDARRRFVVVNNGGGKIFSRLPSLAGAAPEFRDVIENRHGLNFAHWAGLWNLRHVRLSGADSLRDFGDEDVAIEIVPNSEQTEGFWAARQQMLSS
ncbi:MAG: 2-succinyl-5-enolpyruvyl-6-hydroxy-3-cyclohexene-1-carboxylic-acid synthase [Verrucomicrobiae bacterium]|nr:2-succinyl-5-enolpyruvyl-6-hydroxy-3-cyclohexene-1-carboxylic-acid synthase [Verrucomicrobiae bacterium]